jgi:hypothetical protein
MVPIDLVKLVIMLRDAAPSIAGLMGGFHAIGWWSGRRCGWRTIACRLSKSALGLSSALSAQEVTHLEVINDDFRSVWILE